MLKFTRPYIKSININLNKICKFVLTYFISFIILYIYLEPELIISPVNGFYTLVSARLVQQERFLNYKENYNFIEYLSFLVEKFSFSFGHVTQNTFIFSLLCLGIFTTFKNLIYEKKNIANIIVVSFILVANYYYARVGFDRYLFPSFIILNFVSIYGLSQMLSIIKTYAKK